MVCGSNDNLICTAFVVLFLVLGFLVSLGLLLVPAGATEGAARVSSGQVAGRASLPLSLGRGGTLNREGPKVFLSGMGHLLYLGSS